MTTNTHTAPGRNVCKRMTYLLLLVSIVQYAFVRSLRESMTFTDPMFPESLKLDIPVEQKKPRYAIAMYVDNEAPLYGLYSIAHQAQVTGMVQDGIDIVVGVSKKFKNNPVLQQMLQDGLINQIYPFDNYIIKNKVSNPDRGLWAGVFNKLFLFNLTDYDKLIVLDWDVLLRQNIRHWFEYDTPCASQTKDNVEWNSGVMVISPNNTVYDTFLEKLPQVQRLMYVNNSINITEPDNWNSGYHDQGFLSSFYTTSTDPTMRMKTIPSENAILISSLQQQQYHYFWYRRNHIFQTIHLTTEKPWRPKTKPSNDIICQVLREFEKSLIGMDRYNISIENQYLENCQKD